MRISTPRREMYKQTISSLIAAKPKINNVGLARELGLHRNTITKLLGEIKNENAVWAQERWKMLLNDMTEMANIGNTQLNKLWVDSYCSNLSKPSQMATIAKIRWLILKDLYRMHLEYMGIRESPKSLVQINLDKTKWTA